MKEHPFQSAFTSATTGILATAYAFRQDWWGIWILGAALLAFLLISLSSHERKNAPWRGLFVVLISLSLAVPGNAQEVLTTEPPPVEQNAINDPMCGAGAVVGVVVICIGAFCIYKMIKFCQKKFPRDSAKKETDDVTNPDGSPDTDAGAFNYGEMGSCGPCDDALAAQLAAGNDPHINFMLDLDVLISDDDEVVLIPHVTFDRDPETLISFIEFAKEIQAEHGVKVTGESGSEYFSHNGHPIPKAEAIIQFDQDLRMVKIGAGDYSVIVERSFDMQTWEQVLHTEVAEGARVRMVDTTRTGQAFYRYHGGRTD